MYLVAVQFSLLLSQNYSLYCKSDLALCDVPYDRHILGVGCKNTEARRKRHKEIKKTAYSYVFNVTKLYAEPKKVNVKPRRLIGNKVVIKRGKNKKAV